MTLFYLIAFFIMWGASGIALLIGADDIYFWALLILANLYLIASTH